LGRHVQFVGDVFGRDVFEFADLTDLISYVVHVTIGSTKSDIVGKNQIGETLWLRGFLPLQRKRKSGTVQRLEYSFGCNVLEFRMTV